MNWDYKAQLIETQFYITCLNKKIIIYKLKTMELCKNLSIIPRQEGMSLYRCAIFDHNHGGDFGMIRDSLKDNNVIPNNECPYMYRGIDQKECPCFKY